MNHKQKKFAENSDLLQFIIDQSSCAIIVIDKDEEVIITNREHERMTGYSTKYLVGMTLSEMIQEKIIHDATTRKVMQRKETVVLEQLSYRNDGESISRMVKGVPYFNEMGEIEYVICYIFDTGEKRKLIEELTSSNLKYSMELLQLKNDVTKKLGIVYRSPSMKTVIEKAEIVAKTDSTVLILGESGVGKSLIARFLHSNSNRKNGTFLTVNCGAVPDSLIESELFGYEKGAFTGALARGKQGLVELADGGTLFLDEIGDMPYNLQVKLLRLLQEKEFFRVGGTTPIKVNTRIIAATNVNLKEKIKEKTFREDLYYRLNVLELTIPPLRERPEDIPLLVETFRQKFNETYQLKKEISSEALVFLSGLELKGNVRELENLIERLILFSDKKNITLSDLYEIIDFNIDHNSKMDFKLKNRSYKEVFEEIDKQIFTEAKRLYKSTTEIGKHLKINQSTVSRKLRKYGI
ncbi:sigma 54-interacting transcriptional regulator [Anaerovorax odorimutans]|uniref:HTH-type transcriptional regulatory protein TyrR n=1 Tax=Anaerovorax odorimutans TaxID=109327 RepID=A0ABT1RMW1_9FIRM|nr:sigma 54-interacting transcriptional regulator [Anaerovorax odorimutans]MCQ4636518.1 sigma 54-interacting transcriptional regulator [Anaerovorax odorimutans]